jgi:SagB-type dehydrogenase family enzyme
MPLFHQKTKHSFMSIRKNAFFLDWRTQPKNFKLYPHFQHRFLIDDFEELEDLNLVGGITLEREYPDGKYYLRTVPSAGGLFPFELYIQIRGIKGLINGIYHYEPHTRMLCLIHEINNDGVEYYCKNKNEQKGFQFLISAVYFRSSWKYRDRSIRYILLDAGHQLGAIYAALCVMDRNFTIDFDFDKLGLNEKFGFREDEMFLVSASSGYKNDKEIKPLTLTMPYIAPSDYLETNEFVCDAYKKSANFEDKPIENLDFFTHIPKQQLKNAIVNRRSIRAFRGQEIKKHEFEAIEDGIYEFAKQHNIDIFYTVHRVQEKPQALYKNGELQKEGDFSAKSKYLSLEQALGGMSGVTFYFTSNGFEKYQKVYVLAGFLAHIIYLRCELHQIGCSGIGAYYDDETKEFLETSNNILYLLAIGR